jgi:uncharacterized protein (TIGR03086 family)
MTDNPDPRPRYRDTLAWVRALADAVPADRLADPTPCTEYDVRDLLGHLVAGVERARVIGEGGDPQSMPSIVIGVPDESWADALSTAEAKMATAWADDSLLDALVTVPWGRVPGRAAVWGYVSEALVHGWDLAVATGQEPEADPGTAEAVLAEMQRVLLAEPRGGPVPFGAPVSPLPGAGPTERLANWCGHAWPVAAR